MYLECNDDFKQTIRPCGYKYTYCTLGNKTNLNMWENLGTSDIGGFFGGGIESGSDISSLMVATPPPGIHCMPAPGPFLPCNDLFDWWSLRCSVWIVFLLALLGNG